VSIERVSPDLIFGAEFIPGMWRYLTDRGGYELETLPHQQVFQRKRQIEPRQASEPSDGVRKQP
jgi:hypothetical protein